MTDENGDDKPGFQEIVKGIFSMRSEVDSLRNIVKKYEEDQEEQRKERKEQRRREDEYRNNQEKEWKEQRIREDKQRRRDQWHFSIQAVVITLLGIIASLISRL